MYYFPSKKIWSIEYLKYLIYVIIHGVYHKNVYVHPWPAFNENKINWRRLRYKLEPLKRIELQDVDFYNWFIWYKVQDEVHVDDACKRHVSHASWASAIHACDHVFVNIDPAIRCCHCRVPCAAVNRCHPVTLELKTIDHMYNRPMPDIWSCFSCAAEKTACTAHRSYVQQPLQIKLFWFVTRI